MKSHVSFNADQQRIVFSGVLELSDLVERTFTKHEQILLTQPADTAVHLFQVLETFWRAQERKFSSDPPSAS